MNNRDNFQVICLLRVTNWKRNVDAGVLVSPVCECPPIVIRISLLLFVSHNIAVRTTKVPCFLHLETAPSILGKGVRKYPSSPFSERVVRVRASYRTVCRKIAYDRANLHSSRRVDPASLGVPREPPQNIPNIKARVDAGQPPARLPPCLWWYFTR